jgi:hypothetical protein
MVAVETPDALPSRELLARAAYDAYLSWSRQSPDEAQPQFPPYPSYWPAVAEAVAAVACDALLERLRDLMDHARVWRQAMNWRTRQTVPERELMVAVDQFVALVNSLTRRRGGGGGAAGGNG